LADFPADIIKLDMDLTRNLPQRPAALAIVKLMVQLAHTLGSQLIAEGIETVDEYNALRRCGIHLMQRYLFAKPAFEALPRFTLPNVRLDAIEVGEGSRISTPIAVDPLGSAAKTPHNTPPLARRTAQQVVGRWWAQVRCLIPLRRKN
jgi:EAL domain-containing protein (putative c-di-GMP-specific phosphodiesterase class I)